jgi:hypothetical protein
MHYNSDREQKWVAEGDIYIMDNQSASVVLSLCAVIGIVGILIVLVAILILRVIRMNVFGLANMALRTVSDGGEEPSRLDNRPERNLPTSRNLRAQAQSLDFDEAVARKRGESSPSIRTTSSTPPAASAQSVPFGQEDSPTPDLRERRRRRPNSSEDDDGLLDSIADVDDGWL